jgi:chemotaxis family two-component system response regulator Rcp1
VKKNANQGKLDFLLCPRSAAREEVVRILGGSTPVEVLLVEDNPGDIRLTQETFRDSPISIGLHVVSDGVEALNFLHGKGAHRNAVRPDLVLLEMNLPRMDGYEVLAHIKQNQSLATIPTVILTASEEEVDIAKTYQPRADCYLSKPVRIEDFEKCVHGIAHFWLTTVKLSESMPSEEQVSGAN